MRNYTSPPGQSRSPGDRSVNLEIKDAAYRSRGVFEATRVKKIHDILRGKDDNSFQL